MNWRYSESFAGIGALGKAIHRVANRHGDSAELQWYSEIENHVSEQFAAIHGVSEELNIGDITKKREIKPVDFFWMSPPCQPFTFSGLREGTTIEKGMLFYHSLEKLIQSNAKYSIMENVQGLPSGDTKKDFNDMLKALEAAGYVNDWKILRGDEFNIPQGRPRVFVVSIRKDIYDSGKRFEFPQPKKLTTLFKDILEDHVEEKYFLSDKMLENFNVKITSGNQIGFINQDTQASKVYNIERIAPTLCSGTHGYANGYIYVPTLTKQGFQKAYEGDAIRLDRLGSDNPTGRGRVNKKVSMTLLTACNVGTMQDGSIRKITPLETYRLDGFDDDDFYKAKNSGKGKTDTQLYFTGGNTVIVNVIEEMLENLLYDRKQDGQQLSLF